MSAIDHDLDEAIATDTGAGLFQTQVEAGGIEFFADEPISIGGTATGPSPHQLLASALAACTTMTLKLYAARKDWPVGQIRTAVAHRKETGAEPADIFIRQISFSGDLDEIQMQRMIEIADRCPVHRTLTGGARVVTTRSDVADAAAQSFDHAAEMKAVVVPLASGSS